MTLDTPRLLLREFEPDDWVAAHRYESDPDVVRYQSFDILSPVESKAYISKCIADRDMAGRKTYDLAIVIKATQDLIGRVGLCHTKPEVAEGMAWYLLRKDQWGLGYMTEALQAMLELGFRRQGLRRIIADTDPANAGSIRVLQKCGFRQEAHHKESVFIKGRWCDTLLFALLASEFHHATKNV